MIVISKTNNYSIFISETCLIGEIFIPNSVLNVFDNLKMQDIKSILVEIQHVYSHYKYETGVYKNTKSNFIQLYIANITEHTNLDVKNVYINKSISQQIWYDTISVKKQDKCTITEFHDKHANKRYMYVKFNQEGV